MSDNVTRSDPTAFRSSGWPVGTAFVSDDENQAERQLAAARQLAAEAEAFLRALERDWGMKADAHPRVGYRGEALMDALAAWREAQR